jgi:histidinol-phosphatase
MNNSPSDLDKAQRLADVADKVTKKYYLSSKLVITTKPDTSPVTQADTETEQALRVIVHKEFHDAYLGEEGAREQSTTDRIWVVDPIDGTRNYLRGMPVWATLIALSAKDGPLTAVVSAPALGRRWWAARGEGAFTRDVDGTIRKLHVSGVRKIEDASLLHSSLFSWDKVPTGSAAVLSLLSQAWRHRALGDFFNYMLIAEGAAEACFEPNLKRWDIEAPALIVTEAGGSVWTAATPETPAEQPRAAIASNGRLQTQILTALHLTQ